MLCLSCFELYSRWVPLKLASYRLTVREFVLVYGIFKSKTLRFVRLCSAACLLLVQSRKIANTFSKLHRASRSDDTFCEDFFHVSISKATCKRVTLRNNTQQPTTTYNRVCKRTQHACNIQQCCVLFARGLSRQLLAPRFLRFLSLFANSFR